MSVSIGEAELRQQLLSKDNEYKRLAEEHQSYDEQLAQLSRRLHLSEEDRIHEIKDLAYDLSEIFTEGDHAWIIRQNPVKCTV